MVGLTGGKEKDGIILLAILVFHLNFIPNKGQTPSRLAGFL
jgi:hypothetical protein